MSKLKLHKLLKESVTWDNRKFGDRLPTMNDYKEAHDKKNNINEDSMSPSFRRMYNALDNVIPMVFRDKSSSEITNSPIGRFKMDVMQNKPEAIKQWPKVKKLIDKMFKDINVKKFKDEQQLLKVLDKTAKGMKV